MSGANPGAGKWLSGLLVLASVSALYVGGAGAEPNAPVVHDLRARRVDVLATPLPALRAAHDHPAHRSLRCGTCHRSPTRASGQAAPAGVTLDTGACLACHVRVHNVEAPPMGGPEDAGLSDAGPPAGSIGADVRGQDLSAPRCRRCHLRPATTFAPRAVALARPLHFSHGAHGSVGCQRCHGSNTGPGKAPGASMGRPAMADCIDCHARLGRSTACTTCHTKRPNGRLVTDFGAAGRLVPGDSLSEMAHDRDWLVRHRWVGADQGQVCATCHSERDCERCHDGQAPPRGVHPGDFLSLHPQQARRAPATCTSCHTVQRFCAECHARLGLRAGSAPSLSATQRVHPPARQWLRGGGHAIAARRDLASCASCHAERDCVLCHGATGASGAAAAPSPHGPRFADRCRAMAATNDRACRLCHGPTPPPCPR